MKRSIALIIGWLAAGAALHYATFLLDLDWDLFGWDPQFNILAVGCIISASGALMGIWFLARATRDTASRIVSLLVCVALVGFAVFFFLPAEPTTDFFLGRSAISPLWFRGGLTFLRSLPVAFWIWWFLRSRRHPTQLSVATNGSPVGDRP